MCLSIVGRICLFFSQILPHYTISFGPADDWIQGIEDKLKEFLISCVETNLNNTLSLLTSGMSTSGIGSSVNLYINNSPLDSSVSTVISGGASLGAWDTIKDISDASIVPIAITIVAIISVYDLVQMIASGNNMRDFDTAIFFKWIFKTNIAIYLCSNVYSIAGAIFDIGAKAARSAKGSMKVMLEDSNKLENLHKALESYNHGELFLISMLAGFVSIVVFVMFGVILVVLCSRVIEALMYMAVSPIPMATMLNSEWRQIGNSWIRGVIALAFQGFFIVIALAFFSSLFSDVFGELSEKAKAATVIMGMLKLLGYSLALIFTVLRTERISKTMFAAT